MSSSIDGKVLDIIDQLNSFFPSTRAKGYQKLSSFLTEDIINITNSHIETLFTKLLLKPKFLNKKSNNHRLIIYTSISKIIHRHVSIISSSRLHEIVVILLDKTQNDNYVDIQILCLSGLAISIQYITLMDLIEKIITLSLANCSHDNEQIRMNSTWILSNIIEYKKFSDIKSNLFYIQLLSSLEKIIQEDSYGKTRSYGMIAYYYLLEQEQLLCETKDQITIYELFYLKASEDHDDRVRNYSIKGLNYLLDHETTILWDDSTILTSLADLFLKKCQDRYPNTRTNSIYGLSKLIERNLYPKEFVEELLLVFISKIDDNNDSMITKYNILYSLSNLIKYQNIPTNHSKFDEILVILIRKIDDRDIFIRQNSLQSILKILDNYFLTIKTEANSKDSSSEGMISLDNRFNLSAGVIQDLFLLLLRKCEDKEEKILNISVIGLIKFIEYQYFPKQSNQIEEILRLFYRRIKEVKETKSILFGFYQLIRYQYITTRLQIEEIYQLYLENIDHGSKERRNSCLVGLNYLLQNQLLFPFTQQQQPPRPKSQLQPEPEPQPEPEQLMMKAAVRDDQSTVVMDSLTDMIEESSSGSLSPYANEIDRLYLLYMRIIEFGENFLVIKRNCFLGLSCLIHHYTLSSLRHHDILDLLTQKLNDYSKDDKIFSICIDIFLYYFHQNFYYYYTKLDTIVLILLNNTQITSSMDYLLATSISSTQPLSPTSTSTSTSTPTQSQTPSISSSQQQTISLAGPSLSTSQPVSPSSQLSKDNSLSILSTKKISSVDTVSTTTINKKTISKSKPKYLTYETLLLVQSFLQQVYDGRYSIRLKIIKNILKQCESKLSDLNYYLRQVQMNSYRNSNNNNNGINDEDDKNKILLEEFYNIQSIRG